MRLPIRRLLFLAALLPKISAALEDVDKDTKEDIDDVVDPPYEERGNDQGFNFRYSVHSLLNTNIYSL
jgi:hypothetical protein